MSKFFSVPVTLRSANDFIFAFHRHNGRTVRNGGKFAVGCSDGSCLLGVAIVGNPLSASYMDGFTAEVLRLCVLPDAPMGVCSFLYSRCWRVWSLLGGTRLITYTLVSESGASLRGSGWSCVGCRPSSNLAWQNKSKIDGVVRSYQSIYGEDKYLWEKV